MKYTPKSKINQDVAKHVMGWGKQDMYGIQHWFENGGSGLLTDYCAETCNADAWNPASRYEHAALVKDALMAMPEIYQITVTRSKRCKPEFYAEVYGCRGQFDFFVYGVTRGKTECEAICLAALRAKNVKGY